MLDRSHTHRSDLNPLGLFVAACSETQRDGDDECNLFHRNTSSFNLPDCANSPAIKCFPSACKIMVRVSSGGSRRGDSMPALDASSRAFLLAGRDRRNIAGI